jgi:hypothetical protein
LRETYDLFFSFNFQLEKLFPVYSGHNTIHIYAKLRRDILIYRNESSTYASDPKQKHAKQNPTFSISPLHKNSFWQVFVEEQRASAVSF